MPIEFARSATVVNARIYDLHPDGNRFAVPGVDPGNAKRSSQAVLVLDFADELRRLVPNRR